MPSIPGRRATGDGLLQKERDNIKLSLPQLTLHQQCVGGVWYVGVLECVVECGCTADCMCDDVDVLASCTGASIPAVSPPRAHLSRKNE
jgi:hypothetical protein